MSEKVILKSCPFCGLDHAQVHSNGGSNQFCVACSCGATVYVSGWTFEGTREAAIESWNRRVECDCK
jgi:Lar family restriction alleviation protein